MKHILLSRCKFKDKDLMQKYLNISKRYFLPSVKTQNANFELGLIINPEDVDYVKEFLDIDFIPFNGINEFLKVSNQYEIQTRHDIDDWFRFDYIKTIQEQWQRSSSDKLLIQSLPIKNDIRSKTKTNLKGYSNKRLSMHLSLCQKEPSNNIMEHKHGQMWKITDNVTYLYHGFTEWIIHGDNISCNR